MILKNPPMGFNTWNTFGDRIDETLIIELINKVIDLILVNLGYQYIVLDDG